MADIYKWVEVEPGIYREYIDGDDIKNLRTIGAEIHGRLLVVVDPQRPEAGGRRRLAEIPENSVALIKESKADAMTAQGPTQILIEEDAYFARFRIGQLIRDARAIALVKNTKTLKQFKLHECGEAKFYRIGASLTQLSSEAPVLCIGDSKPVELNELNALSRRPYYGVLSTERAAHLGLAGASEYFTRFVVPAGYSGHIRLRRHDFIIDKIVDAGAYILFRPAGAWQAKIIDCIPARVSVTHLVIVDSSANGDTKTHLQNEQPQQAGHTDVKSESGTTAKESK